MVVGGGSRGRGYMYTYGSDRKESACQCKRPRFNPWVGNFLWRRKWQPTPVFLPGKSHGHRSLAGYSPGGGKESDVTKQLTHSLFPAHSLFFFQWLCWVFTAAFRLFSSCADQGLLFFAMLGLLSHCSGFSSCTARALECTGFSSSGARAQ